MYTEKTNNNRRTWGGNDHDRDAREKKRTEEGKRMSPHLSLPVLPFHIHVHVLSAP